MTLHMTTAYAALAAPVLAMTGKRDTWASPGALGFIYPIPRTYNASTAGTRPCQGVNVSEERTYIPLSGDVNFWLLSQTAVENIAINYASSENPTEQTDFSSLSALTGLTAGDQCMSLPVFSDLGFTLGDKLTLQLAYTTEADSQTKMYQCADIELVSEHNYVAPSYTCANTSTVWSDSSSSTASSAATVTVTPSSGSVSSLAAGWIGASVTLAVVAVVLGLAFLFGAVSLGRRTTRRPMLNDPIRLCSRQSIDNISMGRRTSVDHKLGV